MKSFLIALIAFAFASNSTAQEILDAKHLGTEATVFLSGAQMTHEAKATVKAGTTEIVFEGLANGLNPKSIQVAAPSDVIIVSAVHAVNYMKQHEDQPRVKRLNDSLEIITPQLEALENERAVLVYEKNMILANQTMSGKETALTADQLLKAAEFYRYRLTDINLLWTKSMTKTKELTETVQHINQQLTELNYRKNQPSNDVVVTVTCFQPKTFTLRLNYFTTQAGWNPRYDLRAKDTQNPVQLDYRAEIRQITGIDWKQIKLKLSSGNPNVSGARPDLSPWNLYVQEYYNSYDKNTRSSGYLSPPAPAMNKESVTEDLEQDDAKVSDEFGENRGLANFTQITEATTTVEFDIQLAQDIPSDGKSHQVMVQSSEINALYRHFAVPKLDKDAFLVARAIGWEKLNLLPGPANIFFEGTFIGESYIDPSSTNDTLDFSLGRDKKVVITREMIQDRHASRFIGLMKEKTFAYEITIRNTKSSAIHLSLEDQIPVSQDKEIEVKLEEKSGAGWDELTGKLSWEMDVKPAETIKLRLIYTVKHPKNKNVPGI
jgi:uncharacterized protein (TIGR02231 family)